MSRFDVMKEWLPMPKRRTPVKARIEEDAVYSPRELREITGISKSTCDRWIAQRAIPYSKMGRLVKFTGRDILAYMEKTRVSAA
jgi:excisionase family DNA binding protein